MLYGFQGSQARKACILCGFRGAGLPGVQSMLFEWFKGLPGAKTMYFTWFEGLKGAKTTHFTCFGALKGSKNVTNMVPKWLPGGLPEPRPVFEPFLVVLGGPWGALGEPKNH